MGRKVTKEYNFNGFAGCVIQQKSRVTQTLVGLYHSEQSGMESDPELLWSTVCEVHHTLVSHGSMHQAKLSMDSTEWCEFCQDPNKVDPTQ